MSSEDYTVKSLLETGKYTPLHSCKKCPYITKSMFFIRNHIKRHKTADPLNVFDCAESIPEIFLCKECNFQTYDTVTFNNHLKEHIFTLCERSLYNTIKFPKSLKSDLGDDDEIVWPIYDLNLYGDKQATHCKQLRVYIDQKNVKLFHCGDCAYKTKSKLDLQNHMYAKHTSADITKATSKVQPHLLQIHSRGNIQLIYCCNKCTYKTKFRRNLNYHITSKHTPPEYIQCDRCPSKLKGKYSMGRHLKNRHESSENIHWFHCDKCTLKTKYKHCLEKHTVSKHTPPENIDWFHCDMCTFKSKYKYSLKGHVSKQHAHKDMHKLDWKLHIVHPPLKYIECTCCTYKTRKKELLKSHIFEKHFL